MGMSQAASPPRWPPPTVHGFLKDAPLAFRTICDALQLGMVFLDSRDGATIYANRFFTEIKESHRTDILGHVRHHLEKALGKKRQRAVNLEIEVRENDQTSLYGYSLYRIDDRTAVLLLSEIASKSIFIEAQQESQFFTKFSELVAEIAHEIGNPLAGINTVQQVLRQNLPIWPPEKVATYIERTINEIDRLSDFLNRIRNVSNENKLEPVPLSLVGMVEKLFVQNEERLKQHKIRFTSLLKEDIEILVDPGAFYQILLNLLNNSLHVLQPRQEIRIYVDKVDDFFITLVYRNNGPAIPEDLLEKIFSPFFTTREEGEGIGLAISHKLMNRMGGTIRAMAPEDGIGAKFLIYIPNKLRS